MALTNLAYSSPIWGEWNNTQSSTSVSSLFDSTWSSWTTNTDSPNSIIWYTWTNHDRDRSVDVEAARITVSSEQSRAVWEYWQNDITYYDDGLVTREIQRRIDQTTEKMKKWKVPSTEILRAQKAQQDIRRIWNQILTDERDEETRSAELTAKELLLDLVGEDELKRYNETGRLLVKGKKYDYFINKSHGVHRIEKGKLVEFAKKKEGVGKYICVHPKDNYNYPETDNVIALKLWIENNEEEFLRIGNKHLTLSKLKDFDKVVGL